MSAAMAAYTAACTLLLRTVLLALALLAAPPGLTTATPIASAAAASPCLRLGSDCGANATRGSDSTPVFYACQARLAASGGGCVLVPAAHYRIGGVNLNVSHSMWRMAAGVVVSPDLSLDWQPPHQPGALFTILGGVTNVSIVGDPAAHALIDHPIPVACPDNVRGIQVTSVTGFTIANIDFYIGNNVSNTSLPCPVTKSGIGITHDEAGQGASEGLVANSTQRGGWPGYGLLQMQTGRNIHFENLDGEFGITLRLETGADTGFVDGVTARNITCRNGRAAFMAGPHAQKNGAFFINDVVSYGCRTTAMVEPGWAQKGKPAGYFSNRSTITGVHAYYEANTAIAKCYPGWPGKWNFGAPACEPCSIGSPTDPMLYNATITDVHAHNFPAPSDRSVCRPVPPTFRKDCSCPW